MTESWVASSFPTLGRRTNPVLMVLNEPIIISGKFVDHYKGVYLAMVDFLADVDQWYSVYNMRKSPVPT